MGGGKKQIYSHIDVIKSHLFHSWYAEHRQQASRIYSVIFTSLFRHLPPYCR